MLLGEGLSPSILLSVFLRIRSRQSPLCCGLSQEERDLGNARAENAGKSQGLTLLTKPFYPNSIWWTGLPETPMCLTGLGVEYG